MKKPILLSPLLAISSALAGTALEGVTFIPGYNNSAVILGTDNKTVLKSWSGGGSSYAAFLTDSGSVVYSTGSGTGPGAPYKTLSEVSWDGTTLNSWTWTSPTTGTLHHAHAILPNGHWLAIGYENLTNAQVKTAIGVTSLTYTGSVYNEHVLEYDPVTKKVVWEWDAKKHFTDTNNPHKINVNKFSSGGGMSGPGGGSSSSGDVMHFNSVAYDPIRDVVLITSHYMYEILVIDHSTTTAEAATNSGGKFGKGGQILFRWGAPQNYGGTTATVCNVVHGANIVPAGYTGAGNYMFMCNSDNGTLNTAAKSHSVAYEIQPVVADSGYVMSNGEFSATVAWNWFRNGTDYANYATTGNFGFVQALPNGNRFISFSKSKRLVEISDGAIVTEISGCSNERVRATRLPLSYKGLSRLSIYQASAVTPSIRSTALHVASSRNGQLAIEGIASGDRVRITDLRGHVMMDAVATSDRMDAASSRWTNGTYVLQVESNGVVRNLGIGIFH